LVFRMTSLTLNQALQILFKGQSNVQQMATKLGMPLEELQSEFRTYVSKTPIDPDVWKGDIEVSWPYWT